MWLSGVWHVEGQGKVSKMEKTLTVAQAREELRASIKEAIAKGYRIVRGNTFTAHDIVVPGLMPGRCCAIGSLIASGKITGVNYPDTIWGDMKGINLTFEQKDRIAEGFDDDPKLIENEGGFTLGYEWYALGRELALEFVDKKTTFYYFTNELGVDVVFWRETTDEAIKALRECCSDRIESEYPTQHSTLLCSKEKEMGEWKVRDIVTLYWKE